MKTHCYWFLGLCFLIFGQASGQTWDWAVSSRRLGAFPLVANSVVGIDLDSARSVLLIGNFSGNMAIGGFSVSGGFFNPFFAKLDSNGTAQWLKGIGTSGWGMDGSAMAVDQDGSVIGTGEFSDFAYFDSIQIQANANQFDFWVAKLSGSGNWLWAKGFGGDSLERGNTVAADQQNNIYVGGTFSALAHFDSLSVTAVGLEDAYVMKLSPNGELRWLRTCAGTDVEYVNKIRVSASGEVYVAGNFNGTATIFGQQLTAPLSNRGQNFIAKLDSLGNTIWVQAVGCPVYDGGYDGLFLGMDLAGNVYFAGNGYTACNFDAISIASAGRITYFGKIDPQGNVQWLNFDAYPQSSGQAQNIKGIAVADNGDCIVSGWARSLRTVDYCNPYQLNIEADFVVHTDSTGNCVCFEKFKHVGNQILMDDAHIWNAGAYFYDLQLPPFQFQIADSIDSEAFVAQRSRACTLVTMVEAVATETQLLAYPNPADGSFSVAPLGENYVQLRIVDALGRRILEQSLHPTQPTQLSNLPTGIYILEAPGPELLRTKVVIRR